MTASIHQLPVVVHDDEELPDDREMIIVDECGQRLDEMILENSGRPRPGPDYEPHHIDGDWLNNTRDNLEWRKRDEAMPSWLRNRLSVMDEASSSIPLLVVGDYLADRVAEIAEMVRRHSLPSHRHPVEDVSQPAWRVAFHVVDLLSTFVLEERLAPDDEDHDPEALYHELQSVFLQLWLGRDKYDDPDPQNDLNDAGERGLAVARDAIRQVRRTLADISIHMRDVSDALDVSEAA